MYYAIVLMIIPVPYIFKLSCNTVMNLGLDNKKTKKYQAIWKDFMLYSMCLITLFFISPKICHQKPTN